MTDDIDKDMMCDAHNDDDDEDEEEGIDDDDDDDDDNDDAAGDDDSELLFGIIITLIFMYCIVFCSILLDERTSKRNDASAKVHCALVVDSH
jgi:hypothetical protein